MSDVTRTENSPHDRLTRLCEAMTDALEAHPERGEEKCIVFLDDAAGGGLTLHGYTDDTEAIVNLLGHLRAVFRANGKDLEIIAIPNDASGIS